MPERAPNSNAQNHNLPPEIHAFAAAPYTEWPSQWQPTDTFPNPQSVGKDEFNQTLNDALSYSDEPTFYKYGNPDIAIAPYRQFIEDTLRTDRTLALSAGLGSGKSTQIPIMRLEEYLRTGTDKNIFVTSPRKLPLPLLQGYVQKLMGDDLAHLIGRRTNTAAESDCSDEARVIFLTERLALGMLVSGAIRPHDDIIVDEVHEEGKSATIMLALLKLKRPERPDSVVIMSSGTFDRDGYAAFMADPVTNAPAKVIHVEGTNFPLDFQISEKTVPEVARELMEQGLNVVVFEPGSARQNETATKMMASAKSSESVARDEVHILNADLSPLEQLQALNPANGHHIVANKVGETSITPENKDAVIDSGLSNIGLYDEGEYIVATVHSSKATIGQRGGRVSRTRPGTHILARPNNAPPIDWENRPDFELPAIQCEPLMSEIALLLTMGIKLSELPMRVGPIEKNVRYDTIMLRNLGATAVVNGIEIVTDVGVEMLGLGIDMPQARSIVESRTIENVLGVEREAVRLQACAIAATQQVDGILESWNNGGRRNDLAKGIKNGLSEETKSDALFELDAFVVAYKLEQQRQPTVQGPSRESFERLLKSKDIKRNPYYKALVTFKELCRREGLDPVQLRKPTVAERDALVRCQIVGAEELFVKKSKYRYLDKRGDSRQLGIRSTVLPELADVLVGSAFKIRGMTERGVYNRRYVAGASVVSPELVVRYAGHRVTQQGIGYGLAAGNQIMERQQLYFDGIVPFHEQSSDLQPTIQTREFLIRAMMTGMEMPSLREAGKFSDYQVETPNAKRAIRRWQQAQSIEHRTTIQLNVDAGYEKLIKKIVRNSVDQMPLTVTNPVLLDFLIPRVLPQRLVRPTRRGHIQEILLKAPDSVTIPLDESKTAELNTTYRNGVALVTVPVVHRYHILREHFDEIAAHHEIRINVDGQFRTLDSAFELLEIKRKHNEQVKARRAARRGIESEAESKAFDPTRVSLQRKGTKKNSTDSDGSIKPAKASKRGLSMDKRRKKRSVRRLDRQQQRNTMPMDA